MARVIEDAAPKRRSTRAGVGGDADAQSPRVALESTVGDLLRARDVSEVLGVAVRCALKLLSTHISFAMLLDADARFLKLEASVGHRTPTFTTIIRPVQAITAVGTGQPVQSSDFLNDSRLDHDPATDDIIRKEGMRTVLAVPMQARGRMLGALYVGHREPRHFPAADVELLMTLADQVAAALAKALHQAELAAQLDQVTKTLRRTEAENALLSSADDVRHAVLARSRDQDGVSPVAVALAESLERPVLVTDWKLGPIVQTPGKAGSASNVNMTFLNRTESREAMAECNERHAPVRAGREWRVAPIEAGRDLLGYLWVGPSPGGDDRGALVDMVMDRVASIVALKLFTKGDAERRQLGDFIYELLAERPPDFRVLEARAAGIWTSSREPHRPVVLSIGGPGDQWGSRLEASRRLVAAVRPNDFATVYGRHLLLFVNPTSRPHVESALAEIGAVLEHNHLTMSAVVGSTCHNLTEVREATLAALRLHDLLGANRVLWGEGLEALTHLFEAGQAERLESLCRAALAPLGRRERLMDALHAYYEAGGNKADAARRLSVHVNTLRQRLERAEQLLGGPVDESIRAVPLRIALLVRQVRAGRP